MELVNYVIINGYRGSFHPRSKLAGYSTEIKHPGPKRYLYSFNQSTLLALFDFFEVYFVKSFTLSVLIPVTCLSEKYYLL